MCVVDWVGGLVGVVEVWVRGVGINMKGEIIFLSFEILGNVFPQFHFSKLQSFLWKVKVKLKKIILFVLKNLTAKS